MKKTFFILLAVIAAIVIALITNHKGFAEKDPSVVDVVSKDSLIKRGTYLVTAMGCDDCHSPKRMGAHGPEIIPELRLSGFTQTNKLPPVDAAVIKKGWVLFNGDLTSAVGAWGASFAGNITSDGTGIGNWSEAQFRNALRKGKYKGLDNARDLLPPMPWQNFAQLTDFDIKAVYTFLKSTRPVKNVVPVPIPFAELAAK